MIFYNPKFNHLVSFLAARLELGGRRGHGGSGRGAAGVAASDGPVGVVPAARVVLGGVDAARALCRVDVARVGRGTHPFAVMHHGGGG